MITYLRLFWSSARDAFRSRQDLHLEILALRQQVAVLTRKTGRPRLTASDRLFWSGLSSFWPGWRSAVIFVQPETVDSLATYCLATLLDVAQPRRPSCRPTAACRLRFGS